MEYSHTVPGLPGEIWITVDAGSAVPAKYMSMHSTVRMPFGPNGPAEVVTRFNLTAYVQDMIKEALCPSPASGSD